MKGEGRRRKSEDHSNSLSLGRKALKRPGEYHPRSAATSWVGKHTLGRKAPVKRISPLQFPADFASPTAVAAAYGVDSTHYLYGLFPVDEELRLFYPNIESYWDTEKERVVENVPGWAIEKAKAKKAKVKAKPPSEDPVDFTSASAVAAAYGVDSPHYLFRSFPVDEELRVFYPDIRSHWDGEKERKVESVQGWAIEKAKHAAHMQFADSPPLKATHRRPGILGTELASN